jgi:phosphonate transport system substrate-binding protein
MMMSLRPCRPIRAIVALCLTIATACTAAAEPLVVATYAYPQRDRAAAIAPLAAHLGARLGRPVDVRVLPGPTALVEAMRAGEVDVGVPNLHAYLRGRRAGLTGLPVPAVPPAQADRYRATLATRLPDLDEASLPARAGTLRLVLVGRDSASGGFIAVAHLASLGLAPPERHFAEVTYAGSHAAALQALAEGRADLAGLAADVYAAGPPRDARVLWRSAPIPPGPLLCRPSPATDCAAIGALLLDTATLPPALMAGLRAGWPEFGDAEALAVPDEPALQAWLERVE